VAKGQVHKYNCTSYQKSALEYLKPPENITVSEWADKYRLLDSKVTAIPGPWRTDYVPYLKDIMNEFNNYETEEIIFVKPTQVGGTEALQNMVGYVIQQDPAPTMIVYPTDKLAESISDNRLKPMLLSTPTLRMRYKESESSKLEYQFEGMYLSLVGSNSPSSLASKPIKYLFLDEVDKYPGASKREADPISLARERTKTFHNSKVFITSTPTLKTGHIWQAKDNADIEKHYFVPCPHCHEYIELVLKQIKFPDEEGMSYADRAEEAVYVCQKCGCIITDYDKPKMLEGGEWRTVRQNTKYSRRVAFWMNTLYSPFVRFSQIAKEFLFSHKDPDRLQNFTNSWLAEAWEDTKLKTSADLVRDRQTNLDPLIVPDWAKLLTAGVDVQETSVYYSIRAWGDYLTSQNIAHGQLHNWAEVEKVMNREYKKADGSGYLVSLALIDSGNDTDSVYEFCANNEEWALPVKGSSTQFQGAYYRISVVNKAYSNAQGMRLVLIDTDKYKDSIAGRMKRENGTGAWMVHNDIDDIYAEQVTAEHKVSAKSANGKVTSKWVVKSSHADNHYLDTEVYAFAAADLMQVRTLHLDNPNTEKEVEQPVQKVKNTEEDWIKANNDWI
jgi:phage terminase large subunit (gpA)